MENCFVNAYVRDRERVRDYCRWYFYSRRLICVLRILFIVCFVLSSVTGFLSKDYSHGIGCLVVVVLVELFQFINYSRSIKLQLRRDAEGNHGQPLQIIVMIQGDMLRVEDADGQGYEVSLSQMKWARQTKKMVLIRTKAKALYVLFNDTFTQGTAEELIAYLRAKGIKS